MVNPLVSGTIVLVLLAILVLVRGMRKDPIGEIRCNRCGYVGPTKGSFRLGRGFVPACGKCKGEDWVVVSQ
jgi:hypothetical protein